MNNQINDNILSFIGKKLFSKQTYRSIDDLLNGTKVKQRKRGGKNK